MKKQSKQGRVTSKSNETTKKMRLPRTIVVGDLSQVVGGWPGPPTQKAE